MPNNNRTILSGLLLAAFAGFITGAQEPLINARDAFFSAADMVAVQKKTAAKKAAKTAPARRPEPAREPGRTAGPKPELAAAPTPAGAEAWFRKVSASPQNLPPPGLRYSLLKRTPQGLVEVSTDTEFHAGDSIRLSVMGNRRGYLYVIARGSSGVWSPLFPHPESTQTSNEIVPGRLYQIPGGEGEYFTFDEQPGDERLFLVFSLKPVEDLEELIGGLSGRSPRLRIGRRGRWRRLHCRQAAMTTRGWSSCARGSRRATSCSPKWTVTRRRLRRRWEADRSRRSMWSTPPRVALARGAWWPSSRSGTVRSMGAGRRRDDMVWHGTGSVAAAGRDMGGPSATAGCTAG